MNGRPCKSRSDSGSDSSDYNSRQNALDRAYVNAWSSPEALAWIESLSLDERRELEKQGVLAPLLPTNRASGGTLLDRDLGDSSLASQCPDFAALIDGPEPGETNACTAEHNMGRKVPLKSPVCSLQEGENGVFEEQEGWDSPTSPNAPNLPAQAAASSLSMNEMVWDAMRRLLGELLSSSNRSLTLECMALVSGMSYTGDSMVEIAKKHGVTRAAVSKRCVELTEKLGLPPSRAMRSLTARKAYSHAQLRHHRNNERPS